MTDDGMDQKEIVVLGASIRAVPVNRMTIQSSTVRFQLVNVSPYSEILEYAPRPIRPDSCKLRDISLYFDD